MAVKPTPFSKVLIANRGEIALRIMQSARAQGLRTVAIYSETDADAPHVAFADEAILIGPAPVADSYLNQTKILAAAKTSGADAIHPGYGFFSENAGFARACKKAGLVFIGPSERAITLMGDKAKARQHMLAVGVPCIPGYDEGDQSEAAFTRAATEIGYPVMIKAAAGGGGRGMRIARKKNELTNALKLARSEAENAFGDGTLILEKAIENARHVEIQVFGDAHGNIIHLCERDCSVQRRHQKVIEESPCPVMTDKLRTRMGAAAVKAASSVDYVGAGTVEFLLDADGSFYFLEMNTRLQVEHPVTEMVTGFDLVALQFRVAAGEPLGLTQDDISLQGHAIEVRLYAEDTGQDFLPATGHIHLWHPPSGDCIRTDSGIETGLDVSPFYDPLLAKIIAWGETREIARTRLLAALGDTALFGTATNRDFLITALGHLAFADGEATTTFIDTHLPSDTRVPDAPTHSELATAAVLQFTAARQRAHASAIDVPEELLGWTNAAPLITPFEYEIGGEITALGVTQTGPDTYDVVIGEQTLHVALENCETDTARLMIDGQRVSVIYKANETGRIDLAFEDRTLSLIDKTTCFTETEDLAGGGLITAPMHGQLLEICVRRGAKVKRGDRLAILEAMKMQHEIEANVDGIVASISAKSGTQIAAGDIILEIETEKAG